MGKKGSMDLSKAGSPPSTTLSKWETGRIIVAFWILGMCNNYIYVIMLSAAHDVISKVENSTDNNMVNSSNYARECNEISTGAILLADVIPTLFVKIIIPFVPFFVHVRMSFVVITGILALVLVGVADSFSIAILGVCFASFNSGLGELTFLAYSTFFPLVAIAAWSSGTGGAGLAGSFVYAGMTEGGLTPQMSLFVSISVPLLLAVAFWIILVPPSVPVPISTDRVDCTFSQTESSETIVPSRSYSNIGSFVKNVKYIPTLLPYMIPVGLVYYFEYLINSGLFELLDFNNTSMPKESQFRWYNAMYQIGVFVSRSSVVWIKFEKIWIMTVLQGVNLVVFALEAIYGFIPNVWAMFALIFWEGLLGGAAYVNTFYALSHKIPENRRLFALSIASVADTFGVVGAALSSFPVHTWICNLPNNPVFRWPS